MLKRLASCFLLSCFFISLTAFVPASASASSFSSGVSPIYIDSTVVSFSHPYLGFLYEADGFTGNPRCTSSQSWPSTWSAQQINTPRVFNSSLGSSAASYSPTWSDSQAHTATSYVPFFTTTNGLAPGDEGTSPLTSISLTFTPPESSSATPVRLIIPSMRFYMLSSGTFGSYVLGGTSSPSGTGTLAAVSSEWPYATQDLLWTVTTTDSNTPLASGSLAYSEYLHLDSIFSVPAGSSLVLSIHFAITSSDFPSYPLSTSRYTRWFRTNYSYGMNFAQPVSNMDSSIPSPYSTYGFLAIANPSGSIEPSPSPEPSLSPEPSPEPSPSDDPWSGVQNSLDDLNVSLDDFKQQVADANDAAIKATEENTDAIRDQTEEVKKGFAGILEAITNLPQTIIDGVVHLFVPTQEDLEEVQQAYSDMFDSKLGFVAQTGSLISDLFESFVKFGETLVDDVSYKFDFPGVYLPLSDSLVSTLTSIGMISSDSLTTYTDPYGESYISIEILAPQEVSLNNDFFFKVRPALGTITIIICALSILELGSRLLEAIFISRAGAYFWQSGGRQAEESLGDEDWNAYNARNGNNSNHIGF